MKLGIIGGTFNPVHCGHVMLAEHFAEQIGFDKVLVIPSGTPPHKEYSALVSDSQRIEMCGLAFNNEIFTVSDMEIKREGKSYTIDTLRQLKEEYSDAELYLMMGADMLMIFEKWKDYKEILKFAKLCMAFRNVCGREEIFEHSKMLEKDGAEIIFDKKLICDVSSTQIREMLGNEENVSGLVPEPVLDYINKNSLYRGAKV